MSGPYGMRDPCLRSSRPEFIDDTGARPGCTVSIRGFAGAGCRTVGLGVLSNSATIVGTLIDRGLGLHVAWPATRQLAPRVCREATLGMVMIKTPTPRMCRPGVSAAGAYGQATDSRLRLEQPDAAYALATRCNDRLITAGSDLVGTEQGADVLIDGIDSAPGRSL